MVIIIKLTVVTLPIMIIIIPEIFHVNFKLENVKEAIFF